MRCAIILAHFQFSDDLSTSIPKLQRMVDSISVPENFTQMSLLGFTASMAVLDTISRHKSFLEGYTPSVERLAGGLRRWMGGIPGSHCGVGPTVQLKVVNHCLTIIKALVGMGSDQGYETSSELEAEVL